MSRSGYGPALERVCAVAVVAWVGLLSVGCTGASGVDGSDGRAAPGSGAADSSRALDANGNSGQATTAGSSPTATPGVRISRASAASEVPGMPALRTMEVATAPLLIDKIYPSMEGPSERQEIDAAELDWVRAYRIDVLDTESEELMGDEFFCHSQLQIPNTTRLIVNATGYNHMEFPNGFAMPISQIVRDLPAEQRGLTFYGMVLNNHVDQINALASVRARIEYWRDEDFGTGPRPRRLYKLGLPMAVDDAEAEAYQAEPMVTHDGVTNACVLVEGLRTHWLVPKGEQRTRRRFTKPFPIDATVHFAAAHMHNRGVWTLLRDATTGEELWRTVVEYEDDRVQIERVPVYSSEQGFKVYKDHDYEIEALYVNPDDQPIDAMVLVDVFYNPVIPQATITYPFPPDGSHHGM